MKKVIGIGACVLDTVICCDTYPTEDKKMRALDVFSTGGGPVSNALVAITRLGLSASFLGALSDSPEGHRLADEFVRYGVGVEGVRFVENTRAFTSYIVLSAESGSRTCVFERGNVPDEPEKLDLTAIRDADILHLDGNSLNTALAAARYAHEVGTKVSLDAGGLYAGIEELLPLVDILIPSEEFAMGITKTASAEDAIRTLAGKYHPEVLAVTEGSRGGIYFEDGEVKHYDSFKIDCVDSNGAGDTFHGAFLVGHLLGYSVGTACEFASAVAALKCTRTGVRVALPTMQETCEFMKKNGRELPC